jgi:Fic-DOC domain mobile mystery protein B
VPDENGRAREVTTVPRDEPPLPTLNVRTIGPEPSGATPLEQEDLECLVPDFVATRADLNQVEYENITKALPWARRQARTRGPDRMLDYVFMLELHRRMFGDVWTWAGMQRRRATNIGVEPYLIATQSQLLLDDAKLWHARGIFEPDAVAARIHSRLASIHPFTNGNGRCTRLMADLYLVSLGAEPLTWGGANLGVDGSGRATYIAALIKAVDTGDHVDLIRFARGQPPS